MSESFVERLCELPSLAPEKPREWSEPDESKGRQMLLPKGVRESDLDFHPRGDSCQSCGACCSIPEGMTVGAEGDDGYVELTEGDLINLGLSEKKHAHLLVKRPGRAHASSGYHLRVLPDTGGQHAPGSKTCAFLEGYVGGKVACDVYERRPRACRMAERGDSGCLTLRRAHYFGGNPWIAPRFIGGKVSKEAEVPVPEKFEEAKE